MPITKQTTIDQITVTENGTILIRETTKVIEDGVELSSSFHRSSLMPGSDLTGQPASVVAIATATWTPANVTAWSAEFIALQEAERAKQVAAAQAAADAVPTPVNTAVATMRQAREALIRRGHFATVDSYIAAMPGIAGDIARNEWNMSQTVERDRPLTLAMAALLGLDTAAMDEFYAFALTL